jgi:hypothetical protein
MDPFPMDEFGPRVAAFSFIFVAALIFIVCVWVLIVVAFVRNRRLLRQSGIDPTTVGSQLAVRFLRGQSAAPPPGSRSGSASDRLVELTDLRDRGLITPQEYQARREQIINGI